MPKKKITTEEIIEEAPMSTTETNLDSITPESLAPTVDIDSIKESIKEELTPKLYEEISTKVRDDFMQKLSGKQAEQVKTIEDEIIEKYGANPTPSQAWEYMIEKTVELQEQRAIQKQKEIQEQQSRLEQESKGAQEYWQKKWDREYEGLVEMGALPKVEPNEIEGENVEKRKDFFNTYAEIVKDAQEKGLQPPESLYEVYYRHYSKKSKQPAGANAPIAGNSAPVAGAPTTSVRNMDLKQIIENALYPKGS